MKRSEMINLIADYLHHALYQMGNDKYHHAEKILVKIEKAGMEPPLTEDLEAPDRGWFIKNNCDQDMRFGDNDHPLYNVWDAE